GEILCAALACDLLDRINPLNEFDDTDLHDRLCMYKHNAAEIFCLLQINLSCDAVRGTPIPPSLQVLITLRLLACGTFHRETMDLCVYKAICELIKDYVKFPDANFPGLFGCVDGCHISAWCLQQKMLCCTGISALPLCSSPTLLHIRTVQHDSTIFQNSSLCAQFEAGQHSGILLGDSRHAQTNFLFTPYLHPVRPEQQKYNQTCIPTRGPVEHMLGIWKNCCHCLRNTLRFEPRRCCVVIAVTAVLHNNYIRRQHGCSDSPTEYCNDPHFPMAEVANDKTGHRDTFVLQHFS
uniref:DDE Tnp4 domain-containing protein n=1 Tax=Acanthochromis polyacanthus TaxID=80966 RepID=A0A3Q1ESX8_9TELE